MSEKQTVTPVALTTFDNPFSPFDRFSEWLTWDDAKGYGSHCYLARTARTSSQFTDAENEAEKSRAIDEIIKYDFMNIYEKVHPNDYDERGLRDAVV